MKICLVTPAPSGSTKGNRVTAERWARLLGDLDHEVTVREEWTGEPCDLLVALHARKSHPSVGRFHRQYPGSPLVVALTGTDIYDDVAHSAEAVRSLELATRLVALQPAAVAELPPALRSKARVIHQSAEPRPPRLPPGVAPDPRSFDVCLLAHLRPVKDPYRGAAAARLLPPSSRLRLLHAGSALEPEMEERARAEMADNPRYLWLGGLPREDALALLAACRLLLLTSRLEGGANVVSEAVVAGVPVISSRISGSVGILGDDYPGFYPVGDTAALAELLHRAETDPAFYAELARRAIEVEPLFDPARERESWCQLLAEIVKVPLAEEA